MHDEAIAQFDDAFGVIGDIIVMRHHDNRVAFIVEPREECHDPFGGDGIEIAGWIVGKNDCGIIDLSACDSNALLLAPGELAWPMLCAVCQTDLIEHFKRFSLPVLVAGVE